MDFPSIPIQQIIPQRPPFVMVDRVLQCDEIDALIEFTIREDNIFLEDGCFMPPGIIEHAAQSCAARMGCVDLLHGEPIKIGYIGDMRHVDLLRLPRCGETLHTHVHVIEDFMQMLLTEVTIKVGDEVIATSRTKVAKTDKVAQMDIVE